MPPKGSVMSSWILVGLALFGLAGPENSIGRKVPNLSFINDQSSKVTLTDYRHSRAMVLIILGKDCPVTNSLIPDFNEFKKDHDGLAVLGIYMGSHDDLDQVTAHAKKFAIEFPILLDGEQACFEGLGATRTNEVFLLDERRVIRYQGPISDRVGYRQNKEKPERKDLALAVDEVLNGKKVSVPVLPVEGCLITRKGSPQKQGLTFHRDIAPILHAKCAPCHHPDAAAPFPLIKFKDAFEHSAMMREVIQERRMPPWFADVRHGTFQNNRALTVEEIRVISQWIQAGCVEGDPAQSPIEPEYSNQWRIGKPDLIMRMPTVYRVPAKGPIKYQFFYTKVPFKKDMWIQKAEIRPGNRAAVHHLIVSWRFPGSTAPPEWITATIPGGDPTIFPEGMARRIPAGAELVWQVHYNATGKPEEDQSEIGFVFSEVAPRKQVQLYGLYNNSFEIPPGANNFQVKAQLTTPRDLFILAFFPHMHGRGKDFEYRAEYPNGKTEVLLSLPQYDSNWQTTYRLKQPKRIPAGTVIRCVAHFDNSSKNPTNPNPKVPAIWGEQSWDEMMIGYMDYYWADGP